MLKRTERYDFNSAQFLFETIGMLSFYYIRANSPHKADLEQAIINFFQLALKNKSDLLNFCLQVIAIFLQLEQTANSQYRMIYESLLMAENWKEENQSVMSSYIQFIIAFLTRARDRLLSDRPAIEMILSKIIEIDHIELFFRFLDAIMQNTSLEEFDSCGYTRILVQGCQVLSRSIQGRKASLLFVSKLLVHYNNHIQALQMVFLHLYSSTTVVPTSTINFWRPVQIFSRLFLLEKTANVSFWQFAKLYKASTFFVIKLLCQCSVRRINFG